MYKYSIEEFINNQWITNIRIYHCLKTNKDFDTHDIVNKRRNFKKLE